MPAISSWPLEDAVLGVVSGLGFGGRGLGRGALRIRRSGVHGANIATFERFRMCERVRGFRDQGVEAA